MIWDTALTRLFHLRYPIIQGGLAYLARAELAAAVTESGGLGQITATTLDGPLALEKEIRRFRELSSGPFAVNCAIGHRPIEELIDVAVAEDVPAISLTGGNPAPYVDRVKKRGAKLLVLVAGVRAAQKAESLGADAVIAVGQEGGGHIGRDDVGTMVLTPRVVDSVKIPVVASGGIADGRGLVAALALGASGIEMGTRFVATVESPAHPNYKAALVSAAEQNTRIIERSLGRPGRVLPSSYVEQLEIDEQSGLSRDQLLARVAGELNRKAAIDGDLDHGFVWGGQAVGLIHDIPTVQQLIRKMVAEARDIVAYLEATTNHDAAF
ncbi:MAG: 2-nitropropane dioxygenase [Sulfobacillus benefaciens]|uniref:Probable nitronate monooxygenase n=1 Tax=Sulfobacillus benefaciens TaxID=453960 RepID=A0A2T2XGZ5_9FIRM|nr:MAG: 2-nitropropane dioxygenase [Sulfobacillus benefaciens]